ncbi:MFS transporter [Actinocorallia populi]|uniref:MFS transporter n=1 Tax=Actinocorallia populi TaxID=2079200 RepID=UPI000D087E48|nr:MFS transporter [Actinocorallia populi]
MKSYLALLRTPGAWRFLLPALCARLPFAMLQLGILLLVQWATGSYGWGGIASAASAVAQALLGPWTGRLADRHGQARVLVPQVLAHAVLLAVLLVLAQRRAEPLLLVAVGCLAGATVPQVGSMVRARWAHLLPPRRVGTAFALESVTDELTFTLAPIVLLTVATAHSPVWALALALVLVLAGTLMFAGVRHGAPEPGPAAAGAAGAVLGRRGVPLLAVAFLAVGSVFGSLQVGLTALTAELGSPGSAGTIYGTFSAGSLVGGLVYGGLKSGTRLPSRLTLLLTLLAAALAGPVLVQSLGLMYGAAALTGLVIAPCIITGYTLLDALVPAEVKTEAYAWLNGAVALGIALGAALSGQLVDRLGAAPAFLVPPAVVALAALLVGLRGASLRPDAAPARAPEVMV